MKKIMVISGASSGIGREFLLQIEKKVHADEIWAIARREDRLLALQKEAQTTIVPICLDLSLMENIKVYQEKLKEEEVEILVLANCAGYGLFQHYENLSAEDMVNMVNLNCNSYIEMISASLPYMKEGSKILNVASCAAFQPLPYINVYAASKSFVLSYSKSLHYELRYRKIHVLAVTPFWTKTEFLDRAKSKEEKPVIISYKAMYDPKKVVRKAIKDLFKNRKLISCYGFLTNVQRILVKFAPSRFTMFYFMRQQKLDGTPDIRK